MNVHFNVEKLRHSEAFLKSGFSSYRFKLELLQAKRSLGSSSQECQQMSLKQ
jgi:hypothetical protein